MKVRFICNVCGSVSPKWLGRCNECGSWNSIEEEIIEKGSHSSSKMPPADVVPIDKIEIKKENRLTTGISELDLVLGGGVVSGSLVLVGGEPGIGKSTLLVQMASNLSDMGKKILYISGEESKTQIKMRSDRLGIKGKNVLIVSSTNLEQLLVTISDVKPDIIVLDSIQTTTTDKLSSPPGSVSQVKEVCSTLLDVAKRKNISTFIVGHVTKSGNIAGPKVLEHMVDTVLYFEGDSTSLNRILRSVKNRFGSTNEVGLFRMTSKGLIEVKNPSELFLSNGDLEEPGTVIFPIIEGTRPLLVEIQSLVANTNFGTPRRMAIGIDYNALILSCAILEKKRGLYLDNKDIYINAVGGIVISEPAISLPIIVSIASSILSKKVDNKTVIMGEVGLLGEVRHITHIQNRLQEAKRLGYKKAVIPSQNVKVPGMELIKVKNVDEVFGILFTNE
ncbi:MAG: DNA repair protein RadA [Clostridiales bacterium]|nr:MAG: DNA repair protein RadA [Clostridiales bacterium]